MATLTTSSGQAFLPPFHLVKISRLELMPNDYDTKPVNLERLLSKMEALLENRHNG